jgi:hypothetical protein
MICVNNLMHVSDYFSKRRLRHTWNVAVIIACDATIAAQSATTRDGMSHPLGTLL